MAVTNFKLTNNEFLFQPCHNVAAIELLHQETQNGCLGVRRQGVERFGPHCIAHFCIISMRFQKDAKHFRDCAAGQLYLNQLFPQNLY